MRAYAYHDEPFCLLNTRTVRLWIRQISNIVGHCLVNFPTCPVINKNWLATPF